MKTIFDKLLNYNIPMHNPLWYKFRSIGITDDEASPFGQKAYQGGIGASEIGTILYLVWRYEISLKKFNIKTGDDTIDQNYDNLPMFFGRTGETEVGGLWECWDNTEEGFIDIYKKLQKALAIDPVVEFSKVVDEFDIKSYQKWVKDYRERQKNDILFRRCDKVDGYLVNPDYPNFFVSLDFWARKGSVNLITGEETNGFSVEAKTASVDVVRNLGNDYGADYLICGIPFKSYNMGNFILPNSYQSQIQSHMLVTESDYSEIPVRIGSNKFQVNKFCRNQEFIDFMIKTVNKFMENVFLARQAIPIRDNAMKTLDVDTADQAQAMINNCEPLGGPEVNYPEYVSARFMEKEGVKDKTIATKKQYELAKKDQLYQAYMAVLKKERQIIQNQFIKDASDGRWAELEIPGGAGKIHYKYPKSTSKTRKADVQLKKNFHPKEDFIKKIINQLPKNY